MSLLGFGNRHIVKGIDPVADFNDTVQSTDIVHMAEYAVCRFIYYKGVGATGTCSIIVEACDDAAGTNNTAVAFKYQKYTAATDLPGAVLSATTTGFTTTAGSSQMYVIEVDANSLGTQGWVRMTMTEVVNSPVLGGVIIELLTPRYGADIPNTAIV